MRAKFSCNRKLRYVVLFKYSTNLWLLEDKKLSLNQNSHNNGLQIDFENYRVLAKAEHLRIRETIETEKP